MDYAALLYAPVYAVLGSDAVLTTAGAGSETVNLRAIEITSSMGFASQVNSNGNAFGAVSVNGMMPAAAIMAADVAAIDREALDEARLELNGKAWIVQSHMPKPAPNGEAGGEIYLFLTEAPA